MAMTKTAYLSNICPRWPIERQEATLANAIEGWPKSVNILRDELTVRDRRAHKTDTLTGRAAMLRKSSRRDGGEIYVASLAVLAWAVEDLLMCITSAAERRSTIVVLDADLHIDASANAAVLHKAIEAFAAGRRSRIAGEAGMLGGEVSGARRSAVAKTAAETIAYEWGQPGTLYRTKDLLARAGISMNTAKLYLGSRPAAQRAVAAAIKRKKS
jgi:hypothetical protein